MNLRLSMISLRMLTIVAIAMVTVFLLASAVFAGGTEPRGGTAVTVSYQVQPGDSLWTIAAAHDSDADRRALVDEIVTINELESSLLSIGQMLHLPAE